MTKSVRILTVFLAMTALSVSSSGQDRNLWRTAADIRDRVRGSIVGTVVDVDEGRKQVTLTADDDVSARATVLTDSVSTQYLGFGGVINGAPEVFRGSSGFANVRVGDRVEIRGIGRGNFTIAAETISLLGRSVEATQTGVGSTRLPNEVSTPTVAATAQAAGRIEGVVRQVNANDYRIVIETDRREIVNVRGNSGTPVYYRGEVYQLRNLEVGDRIRVEVESGATTGEVRARVIDVIRSVQEAGTGSTGNRVTSVAGRVSRVDRAADVIRVDTGRGEVRVDLSRAADATGRRMRASDLQVGDRVDITGNYSGSSDLFVATTVRFSDDVLQPGDRDNDAGPGVSDYVIVTITGTVTETLEDSPRLVVRDRTTSRNIDIHVTEDFVVRTRTGTYTTADKLRSGNNVLIKAFRDQDGNHVAQTIRIRTEASR